MDPDYLAMITSMYGLPDPNNGAPLSLAPVGGNPGQPMTGSVAGGLPGVGLTPPMSANKPMSGSVAGGLPGLAAAPMAPTPAGAGGSGGNTGFGGRLANYIMNKPANTSGLTAGMGPPALAQSQAPQGIQGIGNHGIIARGTGPPVVQPPSIPTPGGGGSGQGMQGAMQLAQLFM